MEIKDLGLRILYGGFVEDAINGIISYDGLLYDYIEDDSNVILMFKGEKIDTYPGTFNNGNFTHNNKAVDMLCCAITSNNLCCKGCEFYYLNYLFSKCYYNGRYYTISDVYGREYFVDKYSFKRFFEV